MKIFIVNLLIQKIYAYPNNSLSQYKGKEIVQYHYRTNTHPFFTALHDL